MVSCSRVEYRLFWQWAAFALTRNITVVELGQGRNSFRGVSYVIGRRERPGLRRNSLLRFFFIQKISLIFAQCHLFLISSKEKGCTPLLWTTSRIIQRVHHLLLLFILVKWKEMYFRTDSKTRSFSRLLKKSLKSSNKISAEQSDEE